MGKSFRYDHVFGILIGQRNFAARIRACNLSAAEIDSAGDRRRQLPLNFIGEFSVLRRQRRIAQAVINKRDVTVDTGREFTFRLTFQ